MDLRDQADLFAYWAGRVPDDETPATDALRRRTTPFEDFYGITSAQRAEEEEPIREPNDKPNLWDLIHRLEPTITSENAVGGWGNKGIREIAKVMNYSPIQTNRVFFTLTEADFIRALHPKLGATFTCPRSLHPDLRGTALYVTCQNSGQWFGPMLRAQTTLRRRELAPGNFLFQLVGKP